MRIRARCRVIPYLILFLVSSLLTARAEASPSPTCLGLPATITGTAGLDILVGTPGPDVISGMGGTDFIWSLGGNDVVCGGEGVDVIFTGAGDDTIDGGDGSDLIFAGTGNDVVQSGAGGDYVDGGDGNDLIFAGTGNDIVLGRSGDDFMDGGAGINRCFGAAGIDHANLCSFSDIPTPISSSASLLPGNNLIVQVDGATNLPGDVYVEYLSSSGGDLLRSRFEPTNGTDYAVHAVRLRPDTIYSYRVVGKNAAGETSAGPVDTFVSGSLPPGLQGATFDVIEGEPSFELTLMDFTDEDFQGMVAIDGDGELVWYFDMVDHGVGPPLAQRTSGNLVYMMDSAASIGFAIREITPLGDEVVRADAPCGPNGPWHHEIELLDDGSVMFLSRDIRDSFDDPTRLQEGDTINVWDPVSGDVDELWNIFDFIDPTVDRTPDSDLTFGALWRGCSGTEPTQDWSHGNSVRRSDDGSTIYSARHLDQVIAIEPDFQSLRFRLGGPSGGFTFPDPADRFYHQHSASMLQNGNVLLFDNGNGRPAAEGGEYSRALELSLNFATMEAEKVWEYRNVPDLFATCCSNVNRLENGNTLLVFGPDFSEDICCRRFTVVESDALGNPVWKLEMRSPFKIVQYRVYPIDSIMGESRIPLP